MFFETLHLFGEVLHDAMTDIGDGPPSLFCRRRAEDRNGVLEPRLFSDGHAKKRDRGEEQHEGIDGALKHFEGHGSLKR